MSDLPFTTSPLRRASSSRRMRGAAIFLLLLICAIAAMVSVSGVPGQW